MEPLDPGQTPGAIYTGEPLPEPTPQLPDAARKPTLAGAEAMFEHFLELYTYTYATGDTAPLTAVSTKECVVCQNTLRKAEKNRRNGYHSDGRRVTIEGMVSTWEERSERAVVTATVHQSDGAILNQDGTVALKVPAASEVFNAHLTWESTRWVMGLTTTGAE